MSTEVFLTRAGKLVMIEVLKDFSRKIEQLVDNGPDSLTEDQTRDYLEIVASIFRAKSL